jgi:DNA-binding beta-propeller fold protein YncE
MSRILALAGFVLVLGSGCDRSREARQDASQPDATVAEGWHPHEGSTLEYRVQIRFGEELENKAPSGAMPQGWKLGRVSGVATDAQGDVYVLHRGADADPVLVFDRKGTRLLRSWGRGTFTKPHGIRVDPEGNVWITDVGDHRVFKFSADGTLLLELGRRGEPGSADGFFNRPADIAFGSSGDAYVVDQGEDEERPGLGAPRIARIARADGAFLGAWGRPGTGPGEFHFPHAIAVDARGRVFVSDRENNRVQVFDAAGTFEREWTHLGSTISLTFDQDGGLWMLNHRDNIQILTYDALAGRIMRVDPETGRILGAMESPGHMLDVSTNGDLYVASLTGNVFRFYPGWLVERDGGISPR